MVPQYGFHHVGLGLGFFGELGVDVSAVMVWGLGVIRKWKWSLLASSGRIRMFTALKLTSS